MKLTDILKTVTNVGSGIFLGAPIFADKPKLQDLPALIPNNTSNKIAAAIATIEHLTSTLESMKAMTGPQKLEMAAAIAKDAILMSSALTNTKVVDQVRFDLGVSKITDGFNDVIKSVEKK